MSDWRWLFPTQFTSNWREKRVIVVPCWFQQCLEPVNTFISEWSSEARPFRRLSSQPRRSAYAIISEIISLGYSCFFLKNALNFMYPENFRNAFVFEIMTFEVVAVKLLPEYLSSAVENAFYFWDNGVWNCCGKFFILLPEYLSSVNAWKNSLKTYDSGWLLVSCWTQFTSNWRVSRKEGKSSAVLISAVFGTR